MNALCWVYFVFSIRGPNCHNRANPRTSPTCNTFTWVNFIRHYYLLLSKDKIYWNIAMNDIYKCNAPKTANWLRVVSSRTSAYAFFNFCTFVMIVAGNEYFLFFRRKFNKFSRTCCNTCSATDTFIIKHKCNTV